MRKDLETGVLNKGDGKGQLPEYADILEKIKKIESELVVRRDRLDDSRQAVGIRQNLLNKFLASGKGLADTKNERDHFLLNPEFLDYYKKMVVSLEERIRVDEFKLSKLIEKKDARVQEFQEAAHKQISGEVRNAIFREKSAKRLKRDQHQQSCL